MRKTNTKPGFQSVINPGFGFGKMNGFTRRAPGFPKPGFQSLAGTVQLTYVIDVTDRADSVRCAMVVERCLLQHNVARTLAAALMTSYVVSVVQALKSTYNCGVGEFYDEVFEECRNCRLLCDPVYRTFQQCADKCPGNERGLLGSAA